MAIFDPKSRYVTPPLETYAVVDARGRTVQALPTPDPIPEVSIGLHVRKQHERLDQLAAAYLNDPSGFWRFADLAGVVLPDALAEQQLIAVPQRNR